MMSALEARMKLNAKDAADVLKTFIQEDRTEARLYRGRVQNISYVLTAASFAISAFLIGKVAPAALRYMTVLVDIGMIAVMAIFFWRIRRDLVPLRKALEARQDLLNGLREGEQVEIDPFMNVEQKFRPKINDDDLYWIVGLSAMVIVVKMLVIVLTPASFAVAKAP